MTAGITLPSPGSPEAWLRGCNCPVMDNARGMGAFGSSGEHAVFVVMECCPLHGVYPEPDARRDHQPHRFSEALP